jgi:4-hydroxybenzoate polyprenyltransferase
MIYLVAVLIPPLYFLIKKKWVGFVVSSFLFVLSCLFAIMVVLLPVSIILWVLCAIVAVWDVRKALMHEHADILATKMAEKMREGRGAPPVMK